MANTDRQEMLVIQRGKPIREILIDALSRFRGERNFPVKTAGSLDISVPTLHTWCNDLGIQINEYRHEDQAVKGA